MQEQYLYIEDLKRTFEEKRLAIRQRLAEFTTVPAEDYFYELVYCLLTPQSSAVNAAKAVRVLQEADIFHRDLPMAALLHGPDYYIRFHNTKAERIAEAKRAFPEVLARLTSPASPREQRVWLVRNIRGFGWKEASHFLRNIGRRDLAILDRHILKHLAHHRVIETVPPAMSEKLYLAIEERFARFAQSIGISMDELDLLFWSMETGQILK